MLLISLLRPLLLLEGGNFRCPVCAFCVHTNEPRREGTLLDDDPLITSCRSSSACSDSRVACGCSPSPSGGPSSGRLTQTVSDSPSSPRQVDPGEWQPVGVETPGPHQPRVQRCHWASAGGCGGDRASPSRVWAPCARGVYETPLGSG